MVFINPKASKHEWNKTKQNERLQGFLAPDLDGETKQLCRKIWDVSREVALREVGEWLDRNYRRDILVTTRKEIVEALKQGKMPDE